MKRILFVDDDKTFRYALSELLSKEFEVLKSFGVKDALKKLETASVDLICSDYNMRDISVPFMLMSSDDSNNLSNKAELYGITFCEKADCEFLDKVRAMIMEKK